MRMIIRLFLSFRRKNSFAATVLGILALVAVFIGIVVFALAQPEIGFDTGIWYKVSVGCGILAILLFIASNIVELFYNFNPNKGKSIYTKNETKLLAEANYAREQGNVDGEITALRQIMTSENAPSDVSVRLGKAYEKKEDLSAALDIYRNVIAKDNDCADAYVGAVRCMIALEKYDEAFEYAEKSTSFTSPKSPDYAEVMANYALVSAKTGDMQTAEYALQEAELAGWEDTLGIREMISD